MSSYPQITAYFKAYTKQSEIEAKQKTLGALANTQEAEQVQTAVEERMGPYMCDNTGQQSRLEKNSYLEVLQDYQIEMSASTASQQQQYAKMKVSLTERQEQIGDSLQNKLIQWGRQRIQLKDEFSRATQPDALEQLCLRMQTTQIQLSDMLTQLSEELEISVLEEQLSRRKIIEELLRLAQL